jgi:2-oxo-4-hydroxy-4-carboxy-5-ureidoimidazoline decarboxylase
MAEQWTLESLNAAPHADFVAHLGGVFEHSPWVAEAVAPLCPFPDLDGLRAAMLRTVAEAPAERRLALIRAHPDLANKAQRAAGLTASSVSEQDGAGLDRLSNAEFERFDAANAAYRAKFGFPFILCVRRHSKDSILAAFERRLRNTPDEEEREAIAEIGRIATLRLAALIDAPLTFPIHGRLSTHVLDTRAGCPAAGVKVELVELSRDGPPRPIADAVTNADGRTEPALIDGRPVPAGTYELHVNAAAYYAACGTVLSDPPFLDVITVRFGVADPEAALHIPLLMTPWGYTTYRGS